MEPFKITCVTCQSRLTVRSAAALGQILACPKCGSMVQVPAPPSRAGDAAASAAAAPARHAATKPTKPAGAAAAASSAPVVSTFDDVADLGVDLSSAVFPPVPARAMSHPSPAATTAQAARGWSATKLGAILAVSAVVGTAVVLGGLTLMGDDPTPTPGASMSGASMSSSSVTAGPSAVEDPEAVAPHPTPPSPDVPPPAEGVAEAPREATAPAADDNDRFAPSPAANAAATADPRTTETPVDATAPATADAGSTSAAETDHAATASAAPAPPRLRIDPLELDPEGLDLASLLADREPASAGANELAAAAPAQPVASKAPAEAEAGAPPAGGAARGAPAIEPAAPPAAPAVLLARKYPAVKVEQMPLARFLDMATTLSAMPVSVPPEELRLAAASATAPISVNATDATIEQVLTAAFTPLRLEPVVEGGQIVLRRALKAEPRSLAYPVDDLVDGDATELARWVQALVAPESWRVNGGAGELTVDGETLRINHTERIGYETILLLERYRTARGLAPRSKYPQELLAAGADLASLDARLAAPATFTFSRPTPARDALRWWEQELGVVVLVDWPALAEQRLAPTARLTASAAGQPWSEALDAVLNPLGLAWRAVDAGTIEITTLDKVAHEPVAAIYRLGDKAPADAADVLRRAKGVENATAFYDAANRVLLLRAPAGVQREVRTGFARDGWLAVSAP